MNFTIEKNFTSKNKIHSLHTTQELNFLLFSYHTQKICKLNEFFFLVNKQITNYATT